MKTAFYCRVGGRCYGFLLPEEAEKLREFLAEHKESAAREKTSSASKNFCRVLDIRVPKIMKTNHGKFRIFKQGFQVTICPLRR